MNKTEKILKEVLGKVNPSKEEIDFIDSELKSFIQKIKSRIKKLKLDVDVFVGGSFAKKTLIRKGKYDIDIFLRFDEQGDLSELTEKILKGVGKVSRVHGSRDYFRIDVSSSLFFEIVPVKKVKNPRESENITDLSFSHVNYVRKKIKSQKILDDIKIAKAFCHAHNCYGAESYVNGFSGYGLELLVYFYKSFLKFIKEVSKMKEKEIIDIERLHRNKKVVMMDINESKLNSPIVLVDPTFKYRNVLAALSEETFRNFQIACRKFLKFPSLEMFELQKVDLKKIEKDAKKKDNEFILLEIKTNRQEGDIAGSKLLKFHHHLIREFRKYFEIRKSGFEYDEEKSAKCFFVLKRKKEILIKGPREEDKKNSAKFKKSHKKNFKKGKRIYAKEKIDFSAREFIASWKKSNKKLINDMSILNLRVLE